jgi:hypothetical protein
MAKQPLRDLWHQPHTLGHAREGDG